MNATLFVQDAVQSSHWNPPQATLFPVVVYKKVGDQLETISYCFFSDYMEHDTAAVFTFIRRLMDDLKAKVPALAKLYFFSDGAAAHFKNAKNFANLSLFKRDYGVSAEWHFFGSGHGKGACDGLGATVKRLHRNALEQRDSSNAITTPKLLYDWAVETIPGIHSFFVSKAVVEEDQEKLKSRYESSMPITGTRSFHSFIPIGPGKLKVCNLSCRNNDYK